MKLLEKSQWWSQEELEKFQKTRLRWLIHHSYNNIPFYHAVFRNRNLYPSDIKTQKDLQKLPIITKSLINKYRDYLSLSRSKHLNPFIGKTGGSTGQPFHYFIGRQAKSIGWADTYRSWGWGGYKFGNKRVTMGGTSLIPNEKLSSLKKIRFLIENNIAVSVVHLNEEVMKNLIDIIKRQKIKYIRGYPSAIYPFAEFVNSYVDDIPRINAIFSSAEMLYPYQRELIEETFKCKIYNGYSCADGGASASECEFHQGFHMSMERSLMECVNIDDNEPVSIGERGKIITTDLFNDYMPFIRYSPDDMGIFSDEKCPCGRELPMIKSLEGRVTDFLKFSNGTIIPGTMIVHLFRLFPNIKEYQVIQLLKNELLVKIVKKKEYSDEDTKIIYNTLIHHCGNDINIKVQFENSINKKHGSKHKFIESRIS